VFFFICVYRSFFLIAWRIKNNQPTTTRKKKKTVGKRKKKG